MLRRLIMRIYQIFIPQFYLNNYIRMGMNVNN
jgi:hypothetical protein